MFQAVLPLLGLVVRSPAGPRHPSSSSTRAPSCRVLMSADFVSSAASGVAPSVALTYDNDAVQGCACAVKVGSETLLLTSTNVARSGTCTVALPADGYSTKYPATIFGRAPEIDLVLLKLAPDAASALTALSLGDDSTVNEGDFVIPVGNPTAGSKSGAALGIICDKTSLDRLDDTPAAPSGTAVTLAGVDRMPEKGRAAPHPVPRHARSPRRAGGRHA